MYWQPFVNVQEVGVDLSPNNYGNNQSALRGTLVVILLVIIAILLVGYFAWWAPVHRETIVIERPETTQP